ncbi:MAG: phosphatase PAP2 family protein [bacterium]|nr:phosphatase PAP2 family protein [bacterium]
MVIDLIIFNWINGLAGKWQLLDGLGIFFAKYFEYVLLCGLVVALVKNFRKYWRMVAEAVLAAFFVRFVLVNIFYLVHFRARPFANGYVESLVAYDPLRTAFPSGHASFYFALSTIIYGYHKKAGIVFYIGSFLIVLARVFAGLHWPSDILAGAIVGIIMGLILNKVFKKIHLSSGSRLT